MLLALTLVPSECPARLGKLLPALFAELGKQPEKMTYRIASACFQYL